MIWSWGADLPFWWKGNVVLKDLDLKGEYATETDGTTCGWFALCPVWGRLCTVDETAFVCGVGWLA